MTIWKFELKQDICAVAMPQGARILNVHEQGDNPCLWAIVDPQAPKEMRHFRVIGTGRNFELEGLEYIGTAHNIIGYMVLHVFEKVG
jgi:hypothetical protein